MPTSIPAGQVAFFDLDAQDAGNVSRHASFSIKSLDYTNGYVALQGAARVYFVPKTSPASPTTVTIQISGTASDGTALPTITVDFVISAAGTTAVATHFVVGPMTVKNSDVTVPPDPGSDTVIGSL